MSPTQLRLWSAIQRRAASLSGNLASLILKAHQQVADNYSETELSRLIDSGRINEVIEKAFNDQILNSAYAPVRERMRQGVFDSVQYFAKTQLPSPPKGTLTFAFDSLSPHVIEAVKELQTGAMEYLTGDIKETVRQAISSGLESQKTPSQIAKGLREILGLSPNQEAAIRNYERLLREGKREVFTRALRDKRFDGTIEKAFQKSGLTEEQITKQVAAYRKRMVAHNAETLSKDTALKAQKLAQRLSWESAIEQGIVSRDRLMKQRIGVADERERPEHVAANDEVRPFDQLYSTGEMYCGETSWNCRCVDRYFQQRAA